MNSFNFQSTKKRALVTGATGFIGKRLVRTLLDQGYRVTCLVRKTSNLDSLEHSGCKFVYGDLTEDVEVLADAVQGCSEVFHLAASTKAVYSRDLEKINTTGLGNLLDACRCSNQPPVVILVSSLAAAGPSVGKSLRVESDAACTVSDYGKSKLACEKLAMTYSDELSISIVRPPIVLGPGDQNGFRIFRSISKTRCHFVPTFKTNLYSVIYVDDLVRAMIQVAEKGQRLDEDEQNRGIYFVAGGPPVTYADLGRLAAHAMGCKKIIVIPVAFFIMWVIAAFHEMLGRIKSQPMFLNFDKYRDAIAGSWACSSEKIKTEVGFEVIVSLQKRFQQTADWYQSQNWLPAQSKQLVENMSRDKQFEKKPTS